MMTQELLSSDLVQKICTCRKNLVWD